MNIINRFNSVLKFNDDPDHGSDDPDDDIGHVLDEFKDQMYRLAQLKHEDEKKEIELEAALMDVKRRSSNIAQDIKQLKQTKGILFKEFLDVKRSKLNLISELKLFISKEIDRKSQLTADVESLKQSINELKSEKFNILERLRLLNVGLDYKDINFKLKQILLKISTFDDDHAIETHQILEDKVQRAIEVNHKLKSKYLNCEDENKQLKLSIKRYKYEISIKDYFQHQNPEKKDSQQSLKSQDLSANYIKLYNDMNTENRMLNDLCEEMENHINSNKAHS